MELIRISLAGTWQICYSAILLPDTKWTYVSVNSSWLHPPPSNPWVLAKKLAWGRDLTFECCLGARNSTRARILWKMKVKLQRPSLDQIFTGENKKKQAEFLTFFYVYVFSQWNFSWSMGQFFGSAITRTLQKI